MRATIITIGDEILIGQIVDTNSAWISDRLNRAGMEVYEKFSIGDDRKHIIESVDRAMKVSDFVVVTGGLGPTKDDITKKTLAEYFGSGMVRHEATHEMVREMLTRRGIEFNELNQSQSMVPECCTVLPNRNGTAPGMWFEHEGRVLVSLPGVPFEMKSLMTEVVMPRMKSHFNLSSIVHKTAITFGLAESVLAQTIEPWESALPKHIKLAYLPNPSNIRLRLSAYGVEQNGTQAQINALFAELEKLIPTYFVGYEDETLQSAVARLLTDRGATLAIAESCTGGVVASRFTAMPGASDYLRCGIVAYSNDAKVNLLGVSRADIDKHTAVSREVVEQMAAGAMRVGGADYGVATTGIAGPDGGTEEIPVGTVWIAVASAQGVVSKKLIISNLRQQNIERATAQVINLLRLVLQGIEKTVVNEGLL